MLCTSDGSGIAWGMGQTLEGRQAIRDLHDQVQYYAVITFAQLVHSLLKEATHTSIAVLKPQASVFSGTLRPMAGMVSWHGIQPRI